MPKSMIGAYRNVNEMPRGVKKADRDKVQTLRKDLGQTSS